MSVVTSPTRQQIDAVHRAAHDAINDLRRVHRANVNELRFLMWLTANDPERMEFPA